MATASKIVVTTQVQPPEGAQPGQLVVVGPDGSTLVTGDAYVIVEGGTGSPAPNPSTGGIDIITNPANPTLPSGALPGAQVAVLTAPSLTNPVFTGTSPDGMLVVSGDKILVGLVAADITLGSSTKIKIRAQDATNANAVEETLTIQFSAGAAGGPTFDINLTNAISNGSASINDLTVTQPLAKTAVDTDGSVKNFGPNQLRRTGYGARIESGAPARYVSKWSADPAQWLQFDWNSPPTVALPQVGIYKPLRVNHSMDAVGAARYVEMTEPVEVGATYTIFAKLSQVDGYPLAGGTILLEQTIDGVAKRRGVTIANLSAAPYNADYNPDNLAWTIMRAGPAGDGTYEMVIQFVAASANIRVAMTGAGREASGYNAEPIAYWALMVTKGAGEQPPIATTTGTVTVEGDKVVAGGAIAALMAGAAEATVFFEVYQCENPVGRILTYGGAEVVSWDGYTSIRGKANAIKAVVGQGGLKGVSIIGVRKSGAGLDIVVNGGDIVSSAGAVNYNGVMQLFEGQSGWLRRITGYNTALSNGDFQARSRTWNRALNNATKGIVLGQANMTFEEKFGGSIADTIAMRADPDLFDPISSDAHVDRYVGRPGKWMSRYVHWTDPAGSAPMVYPFNPDFPNSGRNSYDQGINSEWQLYVDPQAGYWAGTGVEFGGQYCPIKVGGGTCKITAIYTPDKPAIHAKMPNRRVNVNGTPQTDTGEKYRFLSAAITTAHYFAQKYGYFEARMKWDDGLGVWPAFWLLPGRSAGFGSPAEIDILEGVGRVQGRTSSAIHANSYGLNDGQNIDMPYRFKDDFHTFGCLWTPAGCQFFIDGEKTTFKTFIPQVNTLNDHAMYMLINLAIGDGGGWQGIPDATTDAGAPYVLETDYVRVFQQL